jgi:hypothetical protein
MEGLREAAEQENHAATIMANVPMAETEAAISAAMTLSCNVMPRCGVEDATWFAELAASMSVSERKS